MLALLALVALGFFLGMRHATDPDHVIAVTTIVTRQRSIRHAVWIGAIWGLGHTLTIAAVGVAIIVFNVVIPPRLGLTMELAVGLMLVLLGLLNLSGVLRRLQEKWTPQLDAPAGGLDLERGDTPRAWPPSHPHVHARRAHLAVFEASAPAARPHPSLPLAAPAPARTLRPSRYNALRPLLVGIVHGLAGSAAVALLVLATIRNPYWGAAYLLLFGAGTVAGMMVITLGLASTFAAAGHRLHWLDRNLNFISGAASLAFGLFIALQIGWSDGLFTAHPHWVPR